MNNLKKIITVSCIAFCTMNAYAQENSKCGLAGFANYADMGLHGTTGGGQGEVVRVTTREQLEKYAAGDTPRTVIIDCNILGHGNIGTGSAGIKDFISIGSNKTIVGGGNGITLDKVGFDIKGQQNIILRNLRITNCNPDALAFRNTHHVWVDHCDLSSCDDGLLDYTLGSSYLCVSWTKFSYHDKVSICNSGTQHFEDNGRQRATYHHCWFDHTTQRNPRFGYGLGHVFNNLYTNNRLYCVGYHTRATVVVENSLFKNTRSPLNQMYRDEPTDANYADALGRGNKFVSVTGKTKGTGKGFDISRYYSYDMLLDKADDMEYLRYVAGTTKDIEHDLIPYPGNGANNVVKDDKLCVGAIDGATGYNYYICKTGQAQSRFIPYSQSSALEPSTTYTWYAQAKTANNIYTSGKFAFTTAASQTSCPIPLDGESHAQLREALKDKEPLTQLRLQWRPAFDAVSYKVYLNEGTTVADKNFIGETSGSYIQPKALKLGKRYAWRVDAVKSDGSIVKGKVWTFASDKKEIGFGKTELESVPRFGYAYLEKGSDKRTFSGDYAVVGEAGPGCMSMTWKGGKSLCDITTTYFDWQKSNKYKGSFALFVNDNKIDSWLSQSDGKNMIDHVSKNVQLKNGDELRIEFYTDDKMRLRSDYITITRVKK